MKKPSRAALILLIFSVAVLLVCCVSVAAEARHDCTGEHCPVCAHMRLCMDIVHGLGLQRLMVWIALIGASLMAAGAAVPAIRSALTPVELRVRQNS